MCSTTATTAPVRSTKDAAAGELEPRRRIRPSTRRRERSGRSGSGARSDDESFSSFQSGACRLPATGNTFITYGGICTADGVPAENPFVSHCIARWIEVTPGTPGETVFEMTVDDDSDEDPIAWSSFRAEHFPDLGAGTALRESGGSAGP